MKGMKGMNGRNHIPFIVIFSDLGKLLRFLLNSSHARICLWG